MSLKLVRGSSEAPPPSGAVVVGGAADKRQTLLYDTPKVLGTSWARVWGETLRGEGRRIDGGWPGTLAEARARVLSHLGRELTKRRMQPLQHDELERATAATYQQARSHWLELVRTFQGLRRKATAGDPDET